MSDKINLKEELNRILFLTNYRKGVIISEQDEKFLLEDNGLITTTATTKDGNTTTTTVKDVLNISKSFAASYDAGKDDPVKFLENAYNQIIQEVNEKNPGKLPLQIVSVNVLGTASNVWLKNSTTFNGKKMPINWTHYDYEADFVTKNNNVDINDQGYKNNIDLAKRRANKFWESLKQKFVSKQDPPTITMTQNLTPVFSAKVINSGGKESTKAQTIQITMNFKYENTKIYTMTETNTITEDKYGTSTHWCDGTDGANQDTDLGATISKRQCYQKNDKGQLVWATPNELGEGAKTNDSATSKAIRDKKDQKYIEKIKASTKLQHHFITRFQIFSKPVDPTKPLGTWDFYWKDGKIYKIARSVYGKTIPTILKGVVDTKEGAVADIINDDTYMKELLYCMNIGKVQTSGKEGTQEQVTRQSFNVYVEPYLA